METTNQIKHKGPHLGILAVIFTVLFNTGLSFVLTFSGTSPHYPGPWEPVQTITTYFQHQSHNVMVCSFFQFVSALPLGIFTATVVSRLRFLGNKSVGPYIALFGGVFTAINMGFAASLGWVMANPVVAQNAPVIPVLYYWGFAMGGVGYSVPLGLLIAGMAVSSGFMKLLPKWMVVFGLVIACFGELSCLTMVFPKLLPLIPLTRFPGFIWLIIAGFKMPVSISKKEMA